MVLTWLTLHLPQHGASSMMGGCTACTPVHVSLNMLRQQDLHMYRLTRMLRMKGTGTGEKQECGSSLVRASSQRPRARSAARVGAAGVAAGGRASAVPRCVRVLMFDKSTQLVLHAHRICCTAVHPLHVLACSSYTLTSSTAHPIMWTMHQNLKSAVLPLQKAVSHGFAGGCAPASCSGSRRTLPRP